MALFALGRQMGVPTYFFCSFDRVDDFRRTYQTIKKKSARAVTSYAHLKVRQDTLDGGQGLTFLVLLGIKEILALQNDLKIM